MTTIPPPPPSPRPTPSAAPSAAVPSAGSRATRPEVLLARYRTTGDPEALGALFDGTAPVLFRMALSLTADAAIAEDCVQETYLAALESLERYDATRAVMPWLVGILQIMVRRARHERTRVPDPIRVAAAHAGESLDDAAIDVEHDEDARQIRGAIDSLEEPYRSAALLRWRYGLSPAEIADVRGEPPGTVRSLLSRALEKMRALLKATPALALLPLAPVGLAAVRQVVLARGAELSIGAAASAATGGWLGLSKATLTKVAIAAGALAAIGGGWLVWSGVGGHGGRRDGAPSAGEQPSTRPPDRAEAAGSKERDRSAEAAVAPVAPADAPPRATAPSPTPSPDAGDAARLPLKTAEPERPTPPPEEPDPLTDPHLGVDPGMAAGMAADPAPALPTPAPTASDPGDEDGVPASLAERIDKAVANGVRWLKQRQFPNGSWGIVEGNAAYSPGASVSSAYTHPAGPTALALYALLKCGESLDDPYVKRGFKYLREKQKKPGGAYETAMMLLAVTATADTSKKLSASVDPAEKLKFPAGDWQAWAVALRDQLLAKRTRAKTLGWRYMVEGSSGVEPGGAEDLSSTQLCALALLSAERCGIKTDSKVWMDVLRFSLKQQEDDGPEHDRAVYDRAKAGAGSARAPGGTDADKGRYAPPAGAKPPKDHARGFAYIKSDSLPPDEGRATGGMTACGVGSILIARHVLSQRDDRVWEGADAKGVQRALYDGLAWLDLNWSAYANPKKTSINVYHVYYVYCVERCLDLVGNVLLGRHAWYAEMANELVARQSPKGFWDSGSTHKPGDVLDTSFALLALRHSLKGCGPGAITDPSDSAPVDGR